MRGLTVMLSDRGRLGGEGGSACQTTHRGRNSVARWYWLVITVVACTNGAQGEDFTYKSSLQIGIKNQFKCKFRVKTSSQF